MGRREDNKRRTRQALIERGLELYRDVGFDETRVQDIVDKVGVSPATFFNYFPTKDAILDAKSDEATDLYIALIEYELEQTEVPLDVRLGEITRLVAESMCSDPAISRLLVTRTALFFGAEGPKADKDRASQHLLADLFTQGQSNGEIDPRHDPLQLAELFAAALILTTTNWLMEWFGETGQPLEERLSRRRRHLHQRRPRPTSTKSRSRR